MTLYEFISKMIECGAAGMILNVGKYFSQADITPEITDLCDKNKFPLYIMPWEVYLTDVMQTLCDKCCAAGGIMTNFRPPSARR